MKKLTPWDLAYGVGIAIACGISYAIITQGPVQFVDPRKEFGQTPLVAEPCRSRS